DDSGVFRCPVTSRDSNRVLALASPASAPREIANRALTRSRWVRCNKLANRRDKLRSRRGTAVSNVGRSFDHDELHRRQQGLELLHTRYVVEASDDAEHC